MAKTAKKTDPKLWEKVKEDVTAGDKDGRWRARRSWPCRNTRKMAVVISVLRAKTTRS